MHAPPAARMDRRLRHAIIGLGIGQIIGWGTTYFLLSLLARDIGRDLALSSAETLAGASLTLVLTALIGPRIGRWQDRAGSRIVMSTGTVIIAAGLALLAQAPSAAGYFLAWFVIGLGSPMALYASSMTAVAQISGQNGRRAITYLGLMGGFSATIFWPLTAWLTTYLDWRGISLLFAVLNLAIVLPIHLWMIERRRRSGPDRPYGDVVEPGIPANAFNMAFLLFAGMLALTGLIFTAWSLLVFKVLGGIGFAPGLAVLIGSLVGVFQVMGRLGELLIGSRYSVMNTALICLALLPIAFLVLLFSNGAAVAGLAFALLYGVSNGLITIVRGAMTLTIFGSRGYGERLNKISVAQNIAGALAPILGGFLLDRFGAGTLVELMLAAGLAATALMLALRRHCRLNGLA